MSVVEPESRCRDEYSPVRGVLAGDKGGCEQRQQGGGELHRRYEACGSRGGERSRLSEKASNHQTKDPRMESATTSRCSLVFVTVGEH